MVREWDSLSPCGVNSKKVCKIGDGGLTLIIERQVFKVVHTSVKVAAKAIAAAGVAPGAGEVSGFHHCADFAEVFFGVFELSLGSGSMDAWIAAEVARLKAFVRSFVWDQVA